MSKQAFIVTDLGFGDAGKGSIIDYLAREHDAHTVVRFNGGAQAAHNVVTEDGRHHTFSQFGSASFQPDVRTHLSQFMLVNPVSLIMENEGLTRVGVTDGWERLSIHGDALITTPWHIAANRLREIARGAGRHGSCGMGIGETMKDHLRASPSSVIYARDLLSPKLKPKLLELRKRKLRELRKLIDQTREMELAQEQIETLMDERLIDTFIEVCLHVAVRAKMAHDDYLDELLGDGTVLFEGAQGVLLDEWYGFHPYTTWTTTTNRNAVSLLAGYTGDVTRLGLTRAYATRHGAGPFPTEEATLTAEIPDLHNGTNTWQEDFRVGYTDLVMLRYGIRAAGGVDELVVTCLDRIEGRDWQVCDAYDYKGSLATADSFEQQMLRRSSAPRDYGVSNVTRNLLLGTPGNHDWQQALTDRLPDCEPHYRGIGEINDRGDRLIRSIEGETGVPVTITSYGPSAQFKARRATEARAVAVA